MIIDLVPDLAARRADDRRRPARQRTTYAHLRHELVKVKQTSGGFAHSDTAASLGSSVDLDQGDGDEARQSQREDAKGGD
ncbi:hypothetical protein [Bradyrhizobium sp. CCBAU 25338]|uniref:hypothetical protein n=1 Tax=Bradyrhizobium sp. CCBAU 25338 TaxID=1641877 RepID=UPI002302E2C0|nr:hypothetical protein [Bradyrhizobium sp. CCBAU 25338]MDA9532884.1 hypothetical protein [Bradyrhizobium sp. CCBAU 25338]